MHQTGPAALDSKPRRGRLLLLAAPWVLAAGLAIAAMAGNRSPLTPDVSDASDAPASGRGELEAPLAAPAPAAGATATASAPAPTGDSALLPASLVMDVLATARVALGTAGLADPDVGPHDDRWPVATHVVAVEQVAEQLGVVTVHGLVLDRVGDAWAGPQLRAVAVPLSLSPTPAVAGPAWPLDGPDTVEGRPPAAMPLTEPEDAVDAIAALTTAGWAVETITTLASLGGDVVAVEFVGRHPDDDHPAAHTVWMHRMTERSVLLPHATTPAGVPTGEETP